jgi:hypothetical protein
VEWVTLESGYGGDRLPLPTLHDLADQFLLENHCDTSRADVAFPQIQKEAERQRRADEYLRQRAFEILVTENRTWEEALLLAEMRLREQYAAPSVYGSIGAAPGSPEHRLEQELQSLRQKRFIFDKYGTVMGNVALVAMPAGANPNPYNLDNGIGAFGGAAFRQCGTSNQIAARRSRGGGRVYDVGLAKDLRRNSLAGTEVNHGPQSLHAESLVGDFKSVNRKGHEPAIRLPISEHRAVNAAQALRRVPASAREMLADEIRILRNNTHAPNSKLQELIRLNKDTHFWDYEAIHRQRIR